MWQPSLGNLPNNHIDLFFSPRISSSLSTPNFICHFSSYPNQRDNLESKLPRPAFYRWSWGCPDLLLVIILIQVRRVSLETYISITCLLSSLLDLLSLPSVYSTWTMRTSHLLEVHSYKISSLLIVHSFRTFPLPSIWFCLDFRPT